MTGESRWWFVSDLHLDPARPDRRGTGPALEGFLENVVLASLPTEDRHLVLLGDTFELRGHVAAPERAAARVRATAAAYAGLFAALRRCLAAGVEVHVVCGNHDYALMSPAARAGLARCLGASGAEGPPGLSVHPWLLHRRGLFYAEHGNQHHELNRMPTVLLAAHPDGVHQVPATPLETWGESVSSPAVRRAGAVIRSVHASARAERASRSREYGALVADSDGTELPGGVLRELHDVSGHTLAGTVARTARRVVQRRLGGRDRDSYLRGAAERIDSLLSGAGARPLCYVFGHTHLAALDQLARKGAWYANTGTWSAQVRTRREEPGHFPYVVLVGGADPGFRCAELRYWDAAQRVSCPQAVCAAVRP